MLQDVRRELSEVLSMAKMFASDDRHERLIMKAVHVNNKHIFATNGMFAIFFNKADHAIGVGKFLAKRIGRHNYDNDVWDIEGIEGDLTSNLGISLYKVVPEKDPTAIVSLDAIQLRKILSQMGKNHPVFTIAIHDENTVVEFNGLTNSGDQFYAIMMPMHEGKDKKIIRPEKEVVADAESKPEDLQNPASPG